VPLALTAFAEYRQRFDPAARLVLAGSAVSEEALSEIERRIAGLNLTGAVTLTGRVSPARLKALYDRVPHCWWERTRRVRRARWWKRWPCAVPVVALARAAVPYTVGG